MHQNSGLSHPYQLGCLEIYGWSRLCEIKSVTCYCRQLCHNHTHKCTKIHLTNQQTSLLFLSGGLLESLFHPNISWGICDTLWAISFCHAFFFFVSGWRMLPGFYHMWAPSVLIHSQDSPALLIDQIFPFLMDFLHILDIHWSAYSFSYICGSFEDVFPLLKMQFLSNMFLYPCFKILSLLHTHLIMPLYFKR